MLVTDLRLLLTQFYDLDNGDAAELLGNGLDAGELRCKWTGNNSLLTPVDTSDIFREITITSFLTTPVPLKAAAAMPPCLCYDPILSLGLISESGP